MARGLGPPISWYFSKQITSKMTQTAWVLWMCKHTRTLEAWYQTYYLLACGWRFWNKICGQRACRPLNKLSEEKYKLTKDWAGDLYCGISLKWDYGAWTLNISMPGYIKKQLLKYEHITQRVQHCPYAPGPKRYGINAQSPLPQDNTGKLNNKEIKQIQKIVGSILY
jgi:hypothetical protein